MESQPQNPEFRINPETFTHAFYIIQPDKGLFPYDDTLHKLESLPTS